MKALSLHQPYASLIAQGVKTIETRRWPTKHRGDLLIVSTKKGRNSPEHPTGVAVCVVNVVGCRRMTRADEGAAAVKLYDGAWAWLLKDIRPVPPVRIRGNRKFFQVDWPAELAKYARIRP